MRVDSIVRRKFIRRSGRCFQKCPAAQSGFGAFDCRSFGDRRSASRVPIEGDTTRRVVKARGVSVMFVVDHTFEMDYGEKWQTRSVRLVHDVVDSLSMHPDRYPGIECGPGIHWFITRGEAVNY